MIEKRIEAEMLKKLNSLEKSKFRGAFHLNKKMKEYVNIKGLDKIRKDTYDFINSRLAPAVPKNDGKQTPMRQVHHIEKNRKLTNDEIDYIVEFIMLWIQKEINNRI